MSESPGRALLVAPRGERTRIHETRWPDTQRGYQKIVGRVLARVLAGERSLLIEPQEDGPPREPALLRVQGLNEAERRLLDSRLPPPPPPDRRHPASGGITRWALELPRTIRLSSRFARSVTGEEFGWSIELDSGSAVLVVRIIEPVMQDLTQIFRIRGGEGPQTLKGRTEVIDRCLEAHETLGLDASGVLTLLDPDLDADAVQAARTKLVQSWAVHPPDIGERAMALLCARLTERYYAKARKDGSARRAQVVTTTVEPLLQATLGTWEELLSYLGEEPTEADDRPVEVTASVPSEAPPEIADRLDVVRRWWTDVFDPAHATQRPDMPSLWGLVPEAHYWLAEAPSDDDRPGGRDHDPEQWSKRLPEGMKERIDELWGATVLARYPDVIVDAPRPEIEFAKTLRPAARVWEGISLTCWFLCFGPYSRTTLQGLREYHEHQLDELQDLGCPIGSEVFEELTAVGRGVEWLEAPLMTVSISVEVGEEREPVVDTTGPDEQAKPGAADVFVQLRDVVTRHRRAWIARYLDLFLGGLWRRELERAADSYRELYIGRGKPPTVKQAFPKLKDGAIAWFGGDLSALAKCLRLDGPITKPMRRTELPLPVDLPQLQRRVAELLGGEFHVYREGPDYWPLRRRFELGGHVGDVLAAWQATGEMPGRTAGLPRAQNVLKEAYPDKSPDAAYQRFITAVRQALGEVGHPAAGA